MNDAQRYTSLLVADELDITSDYASARLGDLASQSTLHIVHDADRCRLYRISPIGTVALAHEAVYEKHHAEEFARQSARIASLLRERYQIDTADETTDQANANQNRHEEGDEPLMHRWHPNLVLWRDNMRTFLFQIREQEPVSPHQLDVTGYRPSELDPILYELYFFGLVDRDEGAYTLTATGAGALEVREQFPHPTIGGGNWRSEHIQFNEKLQDRGVNAPPDWYDPDRLAWRLLDDHPD